MIGELIMYPVIEIDLKRLEDNSHFMSQLCNKNGIGLMGVTKCFCAIPEAANAMVKGGIEMLADSRVDNLIRLKDIPVKKVLLRLPMESEIEDVIEYADFSLNSEIFTLRLLGNRAVSKNKVHSVIIMIDLGDLREGVLENNIEAFMDEACKIKGIAIKGFGVNLTCYGGVLPDENNLGRLVNIANTMKNKYKLDIDIISGGNSSSVYLIEKGRLPVGINNLRLGEIILLGRETAFGKEINGMHKDIFKLKAQIVELKEKPSLPIGTIGMDAFGNTPSYEDRGIIKRAILAVGRQDIALEGMKPIDEGIDILGASSDHTILDVTKSKKDYKIGDTVEFLMDYGCLLRASTSQYVKKILI